jgi:GT2 family glycosyltransferase
MKIGIAISTYSNPNTTETRFNVIKNSLTSLEKNIKNSEYEIYVVVVVDGPIPEKHITILNNFDFNLYFKTENGGVARIKNTSIRLLLEQNIDIGFLADDDVLYKKNFLQPYVNSIVKGNIPHMGYCQVPEKVHPRNEWGKMGYIKTNYNGIEVMKHGGKSVGCWLSFTPELIKKIGFFKVMDGKYGYEHINFTLRCIKQNLIPYAMDIIEPENYLTHIGFLPIGYNKFVKSHSLEEKVRIEENNKNKVEYLKDLDQFYDCIE